MHLTVTAFDAFGGLGRNSTEVVVGELGRTWADTVDCTLETVVLPTCYALAEARLRALLRRARVPDVLLMTGMDSGRRGIQVERLARNLNACPTPDNTGEIRAGGAIQPHGPGMYRSTIDPCALAGALAGAGLPVSMSDDAGGFVCNHAFYVALAEIDRRELPTRCGFLHLPGIEERQAAGTTAAVPRMSAGDLVPAVRLCLQVACSDAGQRR
jgi:pyroglutamyl-peptidase